MNLPDARERLKAARAAGDAAAEVAVLAEVKTWLAAKREAETAFRAAFAARVEAMNDPTLTNDERAALIHAPVA